MVTRHRVLIVDDDAAFAQALTLRCADLGLEVETASDGMDALMAALRNPPDLFILDANLPGTDPLSLCEKIVGDPQLKAVPVIVLTGSAEKEVVRRCGVLGARYCFKGLDVWDTLKPLICDTFELERDVTKRGGPKTKPHQETVSHGAPPKVLVIDDDPDITRAMSIRLGALGLEVTRSPNARLGKLLAVKEKPDVIITDVHMPGISGERLLLNLQEDPETRDIPVIIVTGDRVNGQENHALKRDLVGRRGAAAYLRKPIDFQALVRELARHISWPTSPVH